MLFPSRRPEFAHETDERLWGSGKSRDRTTGAYPVVPVLHPASHSFWKSGHSLYDRQASVFAWISSFARQTVAAPGFMPSFQKQEPEAVLASPFRASQSGNSCGERAKRDPSLKSSVGFLRGVQRATFAVNSIRFPNREAAAPGFPHRGALFKSGWASSARHRMGKRLHSIQVSNGARRRAWPRVEFRQRHRLLRARRPTASSALAQGTAGRKRGSGWRNWG